MTFLILLALAIAVAVIAFNLALHAMPLMVGVAAFQLAHGAGAGIVLSGLAALVAALLSVSAILAMLCLVRNPLVRLGGIAIFAGPAMIAGYALTHGVLKHTVDSAIAANALSAIWGLANRRSGGGERPHACSLTAMRQRGTVRHPSAAKGGEPSFAAATGLPSHCAKRSFDMAPVTGCSAD